MKRLFAFLFITALAFSVSAKTKQKDFDNESGYAAQRTYILTVQENNEASINRLNQSLDRGNERGALIDLVNIYRSKFSNKIVSTSADLIEVGIRALTEIVKSKRPKWEEAVTKESKFVKMLPSHTEILDFYKAPSTRGPLDPRDMLFSGFGCRQYIEYKDKAGNTKREEVFYLRCKIDTTQLGVARILNHSKFEMYVDSLSFNPGLCDLPNDSLGVNADTRIGFSFERRKDLKFNIHATLKSSWINQAMMVFTDAVLGEFDITAEIEPQHLNENGIFTIDGVQYQYLEASDSLASLKLGVALQMYKHNFFEAIGRAVPFTCEWAWECLILFGELVTGQLGLQGVGGPITTISSIVELTMNSLLYILVLFPLISVNLAVFNLLPIPALDGSRMVFTLIEWVRGKPINRKVEGYIHGVGLIVLFALVIFLDLFNIFF